MFEHFLSEEENNRAANVHNSEPNFFRILRSFAPLPNIQMLFNQGLLMSHIFYAAKLFQLRCVGIWFGPTTGPPPPAHLHD